MASNRQGIDTVGDEERSMETQSSNLSDFIVADGSLRVTRPTSDQGSGIPIPTSNPTAGSVSIFNTSDRVSGVERGSSNQVEHGAQGGGRTTETLQDQVRAEETMRREEMQVTDLASYHGTTVSGLSRSAHIVPRPTEGGETKVDGFIGESDQVHRTETRVLRAEVTTGAPSGSGRPARGNAAGLQRSTREEDQPRMSSRPKTGEVNMDWESVEEAQPEVVPSEEDVWLSEGERLNLLQEEATRSLVEAMERCRVLQEERDQHLERGGAFVERQGRERVLGEYEEGGDLMSLVLLEANAQEEMQIRPSDLVSGLRETWRADWNLISNSKRTEFGKQEVQEIITQATWLINELREEFVGMMGAEEWRAFEARHQRLQQGLLQEKIPRALMDIFPKEQAGEIMQWYLRWTSGMIVWQRQREWANLGGRQLGAFLAAYPGPSGQPVHQVHEAQERTGQNERPSIFSTQGRFATSEASARSGSNHRSQAIRESRAEQTQAEGARSGVEGQLGQTLLDSARPMMEQETPLPHGDVREMSRQDIREHAVGFGYHYRQPLNSAGQGPSEGANLLPPELVRPRQMGNTGGLGETLGAGELEGSRTGSGRSVMSRETAEGESLEGFPGMDRIAIEAEVRLYVEEHLERQGNATPLAIKTLVESIPRLGVYTRKGHEASVTGSFNKHVKDMKPYSDGSFISMPQWWRKLRERADDNGWSLPMLIRFIGRTGGLAQGVNDGVRKRVIDLMDNYQSWLPHYEPQRPEVDNRYWVYLWIDIGLKFIREFHMVQNQEVIEEGLNDLFAMEKYKFTSQGDPLNEDFHKICTLYEDMNVWLTERSSDLVSSPVFVYRKLRTWLRERAGVAGNIAATLIDKALAKLQTEPESVLPRHHMLTSRQIAEIKRQGQAEATADTYRLILERLKNRAVQKDLEYTANSLTAWKEINDPGLLTNLGGGWQMSKADRKRERKANAVTISSDMSTLTLNTAVTSQMTPKLQPCLICGIFHGPPEKTCPFWDPVKRVFNILNWLKFRSVRVVKADGTSELNSFWLKKLKVHGFRGMGINKEEERKKIIADLEAAVARLPIVPPEERRRLARENQRFINMARIEEGEAGDAPAKKSKRNRKSAKNGGEDSSSSSEEEDESDDSSDASGDLH